MEENKCPICGLVVTGDVIQHLTSKEHEAALKVLLEKEAAQQSVQRTLRRKAAEKSKLSGSRR